MKTTNPPFSPSFLLRGQSSSLLAMCDVFEDDLDVTWLEFGTSFFSPNANRVRVLVCKDVNLSLVHVPCAKLDFSAILLMDLPLENRSCRSRYPRRSSKSG